MEAITKDRIAAPQELVMVQTKAVPAFLLIPNIKRIKTLEELMEGILFLPKK